MGNINGFSPIYFEDSLILKNYLKKFTEFISNKIEICFTKLIYRASRDRTSFKKVADKFNNKSNLLFIYLTGNERIFGNYIKTKLENLGNNEA